MSQSRHDRKAAHSCAKSQVILGVLLSILTDFVCRIKLDRPGTERVSFCCSNGTLRFASREDAGRTREYGALAVRPKEPGMRLLFIAAANILLCISGQAFAQDGHHGHYGVGHAQWHEQFYNTLLRKDTKTSCCNMADCRPTESRMVDDHYEVLVDGEWTRADSTVIQKLSAPDGGAHVCAPPQRGANKGKLYCVVLPPET
jgi:hypothetical protein